VTSRAPPHLRRRLRGLVSLSGGQAPQPVQGATGDARSRQQPSPERPRRRTAGAEERHAPPTWLPCRRCRRREGSSRAEEGSHGRAVGGGVRRVRGFGLHELSGAGEGHEITRLCCIVWKNPDGCVLCFSGADSRSPYELTSI
jgi:hypothetical protein